MGTPDAQQRSRSALAEERSGPFRVTDEGITWSCRVCDTVNPLERSSCSACEAPLAATLREPEPQAPGRDPGTAALLSLFIPGAGHAYLRLWGQAIGRAVTSLWVLFVMVASAAQQGFGAPTPVVFAAAAVALWVVAAHDAYRECAGEGARVLLSRRAFIYVVAALLLLSMSMVLVTALGARGA